MRVPESERLALDIQTRLDSNMLTAYNKQLRALFKRVNMVLVMILISL